MGMWINTAGTKQRRTAGPASVPPPAHRFTQTPLESQHQGIRHTGPSPAEIPHCHAEWGASTPRPCGPVPHGGEWDIKQDQRCARSTEGGSPQEGRGNSGGGEGTSPGQVGS